MQTATTPTNAAALAAATPASRERYADFLRALSIVVVIAGHWLMAIVTFHDGRFGGASALDAISGVWLLTWVLQVMPLFFLVGGFANALSWGSARARGATYADYLRARMARLLGPTSVFVGVWLALALIVEAVAGTAAGPLALGMEMLAKPVWFLAVYVVVVAVAPAMLAAHRRAPLTTVTALAAGAVVVDVTRLGLGIAWIGWLNFACVWLFAHQLGFFYADRRLVDASRRLHALLAVGGLGAVAALTSIGVYAPSLVGSDSHLVSNNAPPSIVLVAHTIWLTGLAMLARPAVNRILARPRAWTAVIVLNARIMTIFLWHLTAMMLVALIVLPLGFPQPAPGTAAWWATRPLWLAILTAALLPFVALFGRFERGIARAHTPLPLVRAATGVAAIVVALAGFASGGFAGTLHPTSLGTPLVYGACFALGSLALRGPGRDDARARRTRRA